jgi:hypothetical protein
MPENETRGLAEDIEKHGQREPGVLLEGMVLDGWHRYLACQKDRSRVLVRRVRRRRPGRLRHLEEPAPPTPDREPARRGGRRSAQLAPQRRQGVQLVHPI